MSTNDSLVAFLGPSLSAREAKRIARCTVLPPARQGDVWRALARRPRAIALIDGVFESQPSVWHREILAALEAGVRVFGAASMGALRAAELQPFGMEGVGQVFAWVMDGSADDAGVALLHAPAEQGFQPLTVPQVTVRYAAAQARRARILTSAQERALVRASARAFYQGRTWQSVLAALPEKTRRRWDKWSARGLPDVKADDARACLRAAAKAKRGQPRPMPPPSSLARRRRLHDAHPGLLESLWQRPDAAVLCDAGLRRALLAGWARELGLQALIDPKLSKRLGARLAEDVALERLVLDHAARMLNDGPSPDEALADEALIQGMFSS